MSTFMHRTAILLLCAALATLGLMAPGRSDASPPNGFSQAHQVGSLTSCGVGQSATAADGTDVVFSQGGTTNDVTFDALVRRPGTATWQAAPSLHVPASVLWDKQMVAVGSSDVLLAVTWRDAASHTRFTVYRLATRTRTWSAAMNAFPELDQGDYEDAEVGVTADGEIVAATTYQSHGTSSAYAVEVAYRAPGSTAWHRQSFSGPNTRVQMRTLSVSKNGYAAVSFVQNDGSTGSQTGLGVISRSPASTHWRFQVLDTAGQGRNLDAAVGADGEAIFVFSEPLGYTVHFARAVLPRGDGTPVWSWQSVTASYVQDQVSAAVDGRGHGTVLIGDHSPPTYVHLNHGTATGPFPMDNGGSRNVWDLAVRPDGVAMTATEEFASGVYTGEDALTFASNGSFSVRTLEGVGRPASNLRDSVALGFDAANRLFATFSTSSPDPSRCWYVDQPAKPDVMTSPTSGKYVTHTSTRQLAGGRIQCVSGFWVEARSLAYRWYRSGKPIGTTGSVHKLVAADKGRRLTCRVLATNASGTRTLGP